MNKYEWSNLVEDCTKFLKKIKEFILYIIKFNNNSTIKFKFYLFNCIVKD